MIPPYQSIVLLFVRFLRKDAKLLLDIEMFTEDFTLAEDKWHFTLPVLHKFLQASEPEFNNMDYLTFRQLVFNNPINHLLSKQGGKVFITENHSNVDQSIYSVGSINLICLQSAD